MELGHGIHKKIYDEITLCIFLVLQLTGLIGLTYTSCVNRYYTLLLYASIYIHISICDVDNWVNFVIKSKKIKFIN